MSGSIGLSLTQRYDKTSHLPLDAGKIYFYAAGTTTPQNAYQDVSLTIPWPNPLTLDSGGNVPQLFFADGYVKFRLADADGVTQLEADYVLVMGPTTGEGAAPSVDATTISQTGDLKARYGTGAHDGWVRANGRTIGSSSSGASERANSDCQTLFEYLWTADANLSVSTGRGASANADWVANKTLALPDWRGRALAALDDMGNSAAGRLTSTYFGTAATALGAAGGLESHTLITAELAAHAHSLTDAGHTHNLAGSGTNNIQAFAFNVTGSVGAGSGSISTRVLDTATSGVTAASATTGITMSNAGSGSAHKNVQPTMLATLYMKL